MVDGARKNAAYEVEQTSVRRARAAQGRAFHVAEFEYLSGHVIRGAGRALHEALDEAFHVFVMASVFGRALAFGLLFGVEYFCER